MIRTKIYQEPSHNLQSSLPSAILLGRSPSREVSPAIEESLLHVGKANLFTSERRGSVRLKDRNSVTPIPGNNDHPDHRVESRLKDVDGGLPHLRLTSSRHSHHQEERTVQFTGKTASLPEGVVASSHTNSNPAVLNHPVFHETAQNSEFSRKSPLLDVSLLSLPPARSPSLKPDVDGHHYGDGTGVFYSMTHEWGSVGESFMNGDHHVKRHGATTPGSRATTSRQGATTPGQRATTPGCRATTSRQGSTTPGLRSLQLEKESSTVRKAKEIHASVFDDDMVEFGDRLDYLEKELNSQKYMREFWPKRKQQTPPKSPTKLSNQHSVKSRSTSKSEQESSGDPDRQTTPVKQDCPDQTSRPATKSSQECSSFSITPSITPQSKTSESEVAPLGGELAQNTSDSTACKEPKEMQKPKKNRGKHRRKGKTPVRSKSRQKRAWSTSEKTWSTSEKTTHKNTQDFQTGKSGQNYDKTIKNRQTQSTIVESSLQHDHLGIHGSLKKLNTFHSFSKPAAKLSHSSYGQQVNSNRGLILTQMKNNTRVGEKNNSVLDQNGGDFSLAIIRQNERRKNEIKEDIHKAVKVYLSNRQSKDKNELGMKIPCAPPATPNPEMLFQKIYVPCMHDIKAQRELKNHLESMKKSEEKKKEKTVLEKMKLEKQQQKVENLRHKKLQRKQIYALNKIMTQLELLGFQNFCSKMGISA